MLKFSIGIILSLYVSVFALVFRDNSSDTLDSEQKKQIFLMTTAQQKGISANRVKFGIMSDIENGKKSPLISEIKSYITDSLGLNADVFLEKDFPWTQSLEFPLKNVREKVVEVIPVTNLFQSALVMVIDSANVAVSQDTISTGKDGFALIRFNNNHRITLHEHSQLIIYNSSLVLLSGELSVSQSKEIFANQYIIPLKVSTDKTQFYISGNAFVSVGKKFSVVQVYNGLAVSKSAERNDTVGTGNAISVSADRTIKSPLLKTPSIFSRNTFLALPGNPVKFPNTGNFNQRIIVANAKNEIFLDTIADEDAIFLPLQFGRLKYFVQNITPEKVISGWTGREISLRKLNGIKSIDIFDDTLSYITDTRPFTYHGFADTSVRIFIDNKDVLIGENGEFFHKVMLKDSLNFPEITVLYKDFSGDTISPTIFYTGWDERIKMNDLIMGKPAFTVSRTYKWRGIAPTATNIRVNNEEVALDENGKFEKIIRVRPYTTYPVVVDVAYENGNSKTITHKLTRKRYESFAEQGVREALFAAVMAMLVGSMATVSIVGNNGH